MGGVLNARDGSGQTGGPGWIVKQATTGGLDSAATGISAARVRHADCVSNRSA